MQKNLSEPKYEYLIKKRENVGIKHLNNPTALIEYSDTMDDVYENINDYNSIRKRKKLIVFDDMIGDIMTNKRFQTIIKELFIRCRKLNIFFVFITQSYFPVPKNVISNSTHHLIMKINNRGELKNIAINDSADIDYQDFIKIYREYTKEPHNFLTIDTRLPGSNPLRFRRNLFDSYKNGNNWSDWNFKQKITKNEAQYDLDRKAAKISALSSNNLDKYEYFAGKDLGLKPSTVEQAKFE